MDDKFPFFAKFCEPKMRESLKKRNEVTEKSQQKEKMFHYCGWP